MPRFDPPASIVTGIDGMLAPGFSTVALEDFANSEHSGRWAGGLITINRTLHDVSSYANLITSFNLLVWPTDQPNWKFACMGGFMWANITWASTSPGLELGTDNANDHILTAWNPVSGSRQSRGTLNAHYNVLAQSDIISWNNKIKLSWDATGSGVLSGNLSFSVWGYAIPDVNSAASP